MVILRKVDLAPILVLQAGAAQADCLAADPDDTPASDPDGSKARLQLRLLDPAHTSSDLMLAVMVAGHADELLHPEQSQGYGGTYVLGAGPALAAAILASDKAIQPAVRSPRNAARPFSAFGLP